jgi:glutamate synthase domain-containing protein 3
MVELGPVDEEDDLDALRQLMKRHADLTGSRVAKNMLDHFEAASTFFTRVMPTDYKRVLQNRRKIAKRAAELAASRA